METRTSGTTRQELLERYLGKKVWVIYGYFGEIVDIQQDDVADGVFWYVVDDERGMQDLYDRSELREPWLTGPYQEFPPLDTPYPTGEDVN